MKLSHPHSIKCVSCVSWLIFFGNISPGFAEKELPNPVTSTEILSATTTINGQPLKFPKKNIKIQQFIVELAPGANLPVHKHRFQRYNYVLSGTLQIVETETNKIRTYHKGDLILEPHGVWHYGANIGKDNLNLLIIDHMEENMTGNVILQKEEKKNLN